MRIEEMNEGVRILLERMRTNPEEFERPFGKWQNIVEQIMLRGGGTENVLSFLHDAEIKALSDGLLNIARNEFTAAILRSLAEVNEDGEQMNLPYGKMAVGNRMRK